MDAAQVARSDRKAQEIRAASQARRNPWKIVKLGRNCKWGKEIQETEWILSRRVFSGFPSGNS